MTSFGKWYSAEAVFALLTPERALAAIDVALRWERAGESQVPIRSRVEGNATLLLSMPSAVPGYFGVKVLTLPRQSRERDLHRMHGVVLIFDELHGTLLGTLDGPAVTAVRTAGISAWATSQLSPRDAERYLIIGAGSQAAPQADAVLAVRPIREVYIWNRTTLHARELSAVLSTRHPKVNISVVDDLAKAARSAQIITLATASREPILQLSDLPRTCHINAIGAHEPTARELASDIMATADVYADTLAGCLAEAGDLLIPIDEGCLELSQIFPLAAAEWTRPRLTVMKSVGSAVFDVACGVEPLKADGRLPTN